MSTINDGGPAFPHHYDAGGPFPNYSSGTGMSLRDWFAGQALLGLMDCNNTDADRAAGIAYAIADAMLKARARPVAELNTTEDAK